MERNDATIPWVALIVAAVFWVILLTLFDGTLKHEAEEKHKAEVFAAATAVKPDWKVGGKAAYEGQCQGCHGANGEGGVGKKLTGSAVTLGDPGSLVALVEKGKGQMPAFGASLSRTQLLEVTNYIRNALGNSGGEFGEEVFAAASKGDEEKALKNRSRFVPPDLKLPEIFLGTFVILLLSYGIMGLYSVWVEGEELKPGVHLVRSNGLAMFGILASMLMVVLCSVLFVRQILEGIGQQGLALEPKPINVTAEGFLAGGIFLFLAFALMLYKKFFMDGEALVEEASGEFPW